LPHFLKYSLLETEEFCLFSERIGFKNESMICLQAIILHHNEIKDEGRKKEGNEISRFNNPLSSVYCVKLIFILVHEYTKQSFTLLAKFLTPFKEANIYRSSLL
jgi:uncharacterized membrane protein